MLRTTLATPCLSIRFRCKRTNIANGVCGPGQHFDTTLRAPTSRLRSLVVASSPAAPIGGSGKSLASLSTHSANFKCVQKSVSGFSSVRQAALSEKKIRKLNKNSDKCLALIFRCPDTCAPSTIFGSGQNKETFTKRKCNHNKK